jgi:hypothetical protein
LEGFLWITEFVDSSFSDIFFGGFCLLFPIKEMLGLGVESRQNMVDKGGAWRLPPESINPTE